MIRCFINDKEETMIDRMRAAQDLMGNILDDLPLEDEIKRHIKSGLDEFEIGMAFYISESIRKEKKT